jgi:shikimate kinase
VTAEPPESRAGRPLVVLVGPPGAGKSTVARVLAEALGVAARDTDADIEAAEGRSISDLFIEAGEEHFRRLEAKATQAALHEHRGVLAVGGGAVLDAATRAALRPHRVVFLDVGLSEAARRVGLGVSRPLLLGNVRAQLKGLLDSRRPLYLEVADAMVATDHRSVEQVAEEVRAVIEQ